VFPAVGKVRSDMFVELQSSTSVASSERPGTLQVREERGGGYLATQRCSRSSRLPGDEWLELGASTTITP